MKIYVVTRTDYDIYNNIYIEECGSEIVGAFTDKQEAEEYCGANEHDFARFSINEVELTVLKEINEVIETELKIVRNEQ